MVDVSETSRCWNWRGAKDKLGYGQFRMDGKTIRAPRVAFFLRTGEWPDNACHRCDNATCCNPDHIFNGSRSDNMRDMVAKGRHNTPRGEKHYASKLNLHKIRAMRAAYQRGGISLTELGRMHGVGYSTAQRVISRANWNDTP